ncbi:hypothetical protein N9936_01305 [bacterium]|nr:hypothetical protein [bacterium]
MKIHFEIDTQDLSSLEEAYCVIGNLLDLRMTARSFEAPKEVKAPKQPKAEAPKQPKAEQKKAEAPKQPKAEQKKAETVQEAFSGSSLPMSVIPQEPEVPVLKFEEVTIEAVKDRVAGMASAHPERKGAMLAKLRELGVAKVSALEGENLITFHDFLYDEWA